MHSLTTAHEMEMETERGEVVRRIRWPLAVERATVLAGAAVLPAAIMCLWIAVLGMAPGVMT